MEMAENVLSGEQRDIDMYVPIEALNFFRGQTEKGSDTYITLYYSYPCS